MFRLYHFIKHCIVFVYQNLRLPSGIISRLKNSVRAFIALIIGRFINLRETNMNLALFYIENGKLRDALMRLYIIERWISPNDKEAIYYKAWVYLLQCKYAEALSTFRSIDDVFNSKEITNFLASANSSSKWIDIPSSMYGQYKDFTISHMEPESDLAISGVYLSTCILEYIDEIPPNCQFLEIGSNGAVIAQPIRAKMLQEVEYDVIEEGDNSRALISVLEFASQPLYNNVYRNIDEVCEKKYDVIFSIWGGNQYASLSHHLLKMQKNLKPYGVIIFAHKIADIKSFDMQNMLLLHTKSELMGDLKLAHLQIDSITIEQINHSKVAFVICSPVEV